MGRKIGVVIREQHAVLCSEVWQAHGEREAMARGEEDLMR